MKYVAILIDTRRRLLHLHTIRNSSLREPEKYVMITLNPEQIRQLADNPFLLTKILKDFARECGARSDRYSEQSYREHAGQFDKLKQHAVNAAGAIEADLQRGISTTAIPPARHRAD